MFIAVTRNLDSLKSLPAYKENAHAQECEMRGA